MNPEGIDAQERIYGDTYKPRKTPMNQTDTEELVNSWLNLMGSAVTKKQADASRNKCISALDTLIAQREQAAMLRQRAYDERELIIPAVTEFAKGLKARRYSTILITGLRKDDIIDASDIDAQLFAEKIRSRRLLDDLKKLHYFKLSYE